MKPQYSEHLNLPELGKEFEDQMETYSWCQGVRTMCLDCSSQCAMESTFFSWLFFPINSNPCVCPWLLPVLAYNGLFSSFLA